VNCSAGKLVLGWFFGLETVASVDFGKKREIKGKIGKFGENKGKNV
jgi:hypothetical protein